ncbi:ferrichrome ABC transporter substrate-binding protein [Paenibacillus albidus]|uniref:Ferrichrome ABC transporter substrate-binding protein n=1 Tax=Paenibacillus albidus TaxID=2041023 RepID=A0A917C147_9BACL|nr:iron-hydroxamate ABC transporter substrate-binding protein [Paenibacillus albidus]GGF62986.1 ferrichrome ABC transporter substrate-binding protein [Paenibacillus albidus]
MVSSKTMKISGRKWVGAGCMAMILFLSACGSNNTADTANSGSAATTAPSAAATTAPSEPKTVTDSMGHKVTVPANPQRVLGSYLEDQLVTLGVTPVAQWSVANGIQDYLSAELKDVPTISYDLPLEAVTSFAPDFIIVGSESSVQNGLYDQLNKVAPTYVLGNEINKNWRKGLTTIGELLGKSAEAEQAIKNYDQKAAEAKGKLTGAVGSQSAAVLWLVQKNFFLVDETQASGSVLYTDLGMTPPNLVTEIPADQKAAWNPVSLEKLSELTADHIFLVNSDKAEGSEILNSAIWKGIPAVKAGHVYELSSTGSWLYSGANANGKTIDDVLKLLVK